MNIERLKVLAFVEGHIENFIEESCEAVLQTQDSEKIKEAEELNFAWKTLSEGLRDLRKENVDLEVKLSLAKQALG
jgi:hypothetical protein